MFAFQKAVTQRKYLQIIVWLSFLPTKMNKDLSNLRNKKSKSPTSKQARDLNRHSTKGDIPVILFPGHVPSIYSGEKLKKIQAEVFPRNNSRMFFVNVRP